MIILIWLLCIFLSFFSVFPFSSHAPISDSKTFLSQSDYSEAVADMIKTENADFAEECIVLIQTEKNEIDFSFLEPQLLRCLHGPDGRATLLFSDHKSAVKAVDLLNEMEEISYAELDQEIYAEEMMPSGSFLPGKVKTFHSRGANWMEFALLQQYVKQEAAASCIVAVIDSGTYLHEDFADRVLSGGYDYVDADDDSFSDEFGHGTKVAGIIAECTDSLPVSILPIRVLNSLGKGKMSNLVNAIYEAVDKKTDVLNMSLGSKVHSDSLETAIAYANSKGVSIVSAAGNSNLDATDLCPDHTDVQGFIVVGSADLTEEGFQKDYYSNYGSCVDIYTFGTGIECCAMNGGYELSSGTSFAAPHISALCAILKLIDPAITPAEQENIIKGLSEEYGAIPVVSHLVPDSFVITTTPMYDDRGIQLRTRYHYDGLTLLSAGFLFNESDEEQPSSDEPGRIQIVFADLDENDETVLSLSSEFLQKNGEFRGFLRVRNDAQEAEKIYYSSPFRYRALENE